jgi:outer membrane protein insertion porin family
LAGAVGSGVSGMSAPAIPRQPLLLALLAAMSAPAWAISPAPPPAPPPAPATATADSVGPRMTVSDIRIDGLQRIGAGTVFTYLPIERGDTVDSAQIGEAMRALYRTGFFEDIRIDEIRIDREGSGQDPSDREIPHRAILVVTVVERPAINTLTLSGNKDLKTEDLLTNLKEIGIAEGETFDRLALDRVTLELNRAYNNRGKYNVQIDPTVARLDRNRVDIEIKIQEGKAARIRHINLIGNQKYDEDALRARWESDETDWLSWYRRDDQYSREKLSGDLERTTDFYLDRGHVDISIDSTQVAIGSDKKDMYITASISEGEVYTYAGIEIVGETVLTKTQLERYVLVQRGETFSRALLELTSDSITAALGNVGHAAARVEAVPDVDRDARTVAIKFQVVPGPRTTVRRIAFKGNTRTSDEVLRREMRQFEGAWYSQAAIDRSKVRLQRLGLFESGSVEIETVPVQGSADVIDLAVNVTETSSGQFQAGLGFSQDNGLNVSLQIAQNNYLGTGRSFNFDVSRNDSAYQAAFSITEPYFGNLGIGLGYSFSAARTRQRSDDDNSYDSDQARIGVTASLPLSESNAIALTGSWDTRTLYLTDGYYPQSSLDYLDALGSDRIDTLRLGARWSADTRNDVLAPTVGAYASIGAEIALPGSSTQYFKVDSRFGRYFGLGPLNLLARTELGYGDSYGSEPVMLECISEGSPPLPRPRKASVEAAAKTYTDTDCGPGSTLNRALIADGLPFYENYYVGGGKSLRGFRDNSLGPCEYVSAYGECRPRGGSLKLLGGFELTAPRLFGGARGTRLALFVDAGNVFDGIDAFDSGELRASTGLSMLWRSPMGPISISYGIPLRQQEGDDIERLQFSFGNQF